MRRLSNTGGVDHNWIISFMSHFTMHSGQCISKVVWEYVVLVGIGSHLSRSQDETCYLWFYVTTVS